MAELRAGWWWIDRWRSSTAYTDMSLEEQGAYRNLLDEATLRGGPLPDDERILAKACGDALAWDRVRAAVLARFERKSDGWRNATLDKVLAESSRRAEKQKRYRTGNADGNAAGNGKRNPPRPLDPDQDKDPKIVKPALTKLAFSGQRFKVWTWQHEDLVRALGSIPFDLLAWYPKLDAEMVKSGEPIADEAKWLRERLYTAAGIQRPNLFGRTPEILGRGGNIPSIEETARKAAERAAIPFNRRKY